MTHAKLMLATLTLLAVCACGSDDEQTEPRGPDDGQAAPRDPDHEQDPDREQELRTTRPLIEGWQFVKDDAMTNAQALASAGDGWQSITLPHTWNAEDAATPNSLNYDRGIGWYRLELAMPEEGARHFLEFGAASLVADVWLNGKPLGSHRGGFTQFRFDVTNDLVRGGTNVLLVKVDNSIPQDEADPTAIEPLGGDFNKSGGLYRHVALISTPDALHFDLADLGGPGVYASTTSISGGRATLQVRSKVANDSDQQQEVRVRLSLLDREGERAASAEQALALEPATGGEVTQELVVDGARLWQGTKDPFQYRLVAELLGSDARVLDRVAQPFGIRQMRFDPNLGFFLNGNPVRLHGVAMHQDFQAKGWALSPEDVEASLALVVEIGANAIRLGHYPFSDYVLRRVSELGLVTWAEKPSGLRTRVDTCEPEDPVPEFVANGEQQLRETIRQQYNHAGVAVWSIGNEITAGNIGCEETHDNVTAYLRTLHDVAKQEDATRPTVYAEFPHAGKDRSGPFKTQDIADVFATNRYFLWYHERFEDMSPLLDALHALAPNKPLGLSEYGAGSAIDHHSDDPLGGLPEVHTADDDAPSSYQPEEYASYVHEQNYAVIASKPYLWGAFVWNLFDFGSTNRNEGGVFGINTKGLVTFDRQTRKDPFFFYKANWSEEPVTYITSRRHTNRAYPVTDVKVYSNANSVELFVNDQSVGRRTSEQCQRRTCVFEDVALNPGANRVAAVGEHGAEQLTDAVEWSLDTQEINIATGFLRSGYVSSQGVRFGSDAFFSEGRGGQIDSGDAEGGIPEGIRGTADPQLFKYFRSGEFSYDIPLANGSYDVTLGFLEPDERAKRGQRVFSAVVNGQVVLEDFDILEAAKAPLTAITKTFRLDTTSGSLRLAFRAKRGDALVSNIRIVKR